MKTFHILTFGCQMNYADTARIKTILLNCGFSYEEKQENADIIILVTCSVRQKSEDKITGLLRDIKKNQKIRISGCMIQHNMRNNKLTNKKLPQNLRIGNFSGVINSANYEILGLTTEEINNGLPPLQKGDRGFQTNGFYLPYNPDLKKKSQELRKNMTQAENKLRYKFLREQDFNTARQKIINNYIVDFYIASSKLVIEIDGDTHRSEEELKYDKERTKELKEYGLKVIRFTNNEVYDNFEEVCNRIEDLIEEQKIKTPNPLSNKGGDYEDNQNLSNHHSIAEHSKGGDYEDNQNLSNHRSIAGHSKEGDHEDNQNLSNKVGNNKEKSIVPINNAFNPQFYNLKKTFNNLELFRRVDDTGFLPKILEKIGYKISYNQDLINEYEKIIPENENTSMNKNHKKTAYVPVSTGCNQFCSYCIVPYARGLERNFEIEKIVEECKIHLKNGAEEIVLLGQIVNKHPKFTEIVKEVLKLDGLKRLRYTSPYPTYYSNELLQLHETEENLCPHIHIPFQSGSDKILKSMNRGYDSKQAFEFIDKIKNLKKNISITTDIIVGFPNETEGDFQKTLDLIEYGKFDMIYIGIYSPRPGTYADKNIPDNIPYEIKQKRREKLNELLNKLSTQNNENEVGSSRVVLINNFLTKDINNNYKYEGYTDNMKQIIVSSEKELKEGDLINVKITKGVVFKLYGEVERN